MLLLTMLTVLKDQVFHVYGWRNKYYDGGDNYELSE